MFIPWNLIIKLVLWLIGLGITRKTAVEMAAKKFNVSSSEIFKRGGF